MSRVRTTVVLEEMLVSKLRNMFDDNLSKAIAVVAEAYFHQKDPLKEAYGSLKGWRIDAQKAKNELREDWGE